jgi:hypothetical protein
MLMKFFPPSIIDHPLFPSFISFWASSLNINLSAPDFGYTPFLLVRSSPSQRDLVQHKQTGGNFAKNHNY